MKSNICSIRCDGEGRGQVLQEVEKFAAYCDMTQKDALHMRLLTEELMGMLYGITGTYEAEFYVEKQKNKVSLHLLSDINLNKEERKQLQSVSTSGKNEAARGIAGKIRSIFEECLNNYEDVGRMCAQNGIMNMGMMPTQCDSISTCMWSLHQYRGNVAKAAAENVEEWDELEKSIIAKLADDVTVGINNKKAEVVVSMNV